MYLTTTMMSRRQQRPNQTRNKQQLIFSLCAQQWIVFSSLCCYLFQIFTDAENPFLVSQRAWLASHLTHSTKKHQKLFPHAFIFNFTNVFGCYFRVIWHFSFRKWQNSKKKLIFSFGIGLYWIVLFVSVYFGLSLDLSIWI